MSSQLHIGMVEKEMHRAAQNMVDGMTYEQATAFLAGRVDPKNIKVNKEFITEMARKKASAAGKEFEPAKKVEPAKK